MTDVVASSIEPARQPKATPAKVARDFLATTTIYLAVAFVSGASYGVCALAWNGGTFVRLWLASVVPLAVFTIARLALATYRRRVARERQLDLFSSR